MTEAGNRRLDRIEANLETVSEILVRVSKVVERDCGDTNQIFERLDQRFVDLAQGEQSLQKAAEQLTQQMAQFIQNAEADRAFMREIQTEVREIQLNNQRILEYLFGQQGGSGDLLS